MSEIDELRAKLAIAVEALDEISKPYEVTFDADGKRNLGRKTNNEIAREALAKINGIGKPSQNQNSDENGIVYPVGNIPVYHGFNWGGDHRGVDWIIVPGTDVRVAKKGKIIEEAEDSHTYGRYVLALHDDGFGTLYAHLSKKFVETGDAVEAGQVIGLSGGVPGSDGAGQSTGYHLHFEVRVPGHLDSNKYNVDPLVYLDAKQYTNREYNAQ